MQAKTLYEKLFESHIVREDAGTYLIYIDRHLVHEVTSPQAFEGLRINHRPVWRNKSILAVPDHNVPTTDRSLGISDPISKIQVETLDENCKDSHTSTHGAFGALAMGIGTSEVEHVLATQCLILKKFKTMEVRVEGRLNKGITAKDIALALIGKIGTAGGTGYAIEFTGESIRSLSMEGRMTLCNMAIEAGARAGMVAVDDVTMSYVENRPFSPKGEALEKAKAYWKTLHSDKDAKFDKVVMLNGSEILPQVTWGTSPEMVVSIEGMTPDPKNENDPSKRKSIEDALAYMGLEPNLPINQIQIDKIFIGSCTNSRIEDLREAANVLKGKKIAQNIKLALAVPGSGLVKLQAEKEGLDQIFIEAGFEWREPGCSMCLAMNADRLNPGERCASTSNRNFEGRQGQGGRTHLVSPSMAAAAGIHGHFVDIRSLN